MPFDVLAVVVHVNGDVENSFPVNWGPLGRQNVTASNVRMSHAGGRFLFLSMDRVGLLFDLRTGALVQEVNYSRALSADPFEERLLESFYPLEPYTLPNGVHVFNLHPAWADLRAISVGGPTEVLVRDTMELVNPLLVRFSHPQTALGLPGGDVLYSHWTYAYQASPDSLGTRFTVSLFDSDWRLFRLNARTNTARRLLSLPGEPTWMHTDTLGRLVSFFVNQDHYIADLEANTLRKSEAPVRWYIPSPDGRYLLGQLLDETTVVQDVASGRMWPVNGGNGRPLPTPVFGPDDNLYFKLTREDSIGVWRVPVTEPTGMAHAEPVWLAAPVLKEAGISDQPLKSSSPLFLDDDQFVMLYGAQNSRTPICR